MGQTQTNIKARTQHTAQSAVRREVWQKPDSFWHDYFLWTFLDKSYKGYCCDKVLRNWQIKTFTFKKKLLKAEAFILTWVLFCVRTWAGPVSGTHLGRVGICQPLYSGVQWCTAQYSAGYSQGSVSSLSLRSDSAVSCLARGHKREIICGINVN